jgi:hypothetical protein
MNSVFGRLSSLLRLAGDAANLSALAGFCWAALALGSMAVEHFRLAGAPPRLDAVSLKSALADPAAYSNYWHFGAAWALAVSALGCAWMAALGGRWAFLWAVRLLDR